MGDRTIRDNVVIRTIYCGICKAVLKIPKVHSFMKERDYPLCIYEHRSCSVRRGYVEVEMRK